MIAFVKTHALGNDFILVEQGAAPANYPDFARRICHRNFGVGADGLILWAAAGDVFKLRIFNCDGSEAECSGNGLRCAAAYLIEYGRWLKDEIKLETISGLYTLKRVDGQYEADMGTPGLRPREIPFVGADHLEQIVNYALLYDGGSINITACSTGNPHCSVFVETLDESYVQRMGPILEQHPSFPNRTNVEFIHVLNRSEIEVAFWERGVGQTYASGTGSCGATVACILNKKTERRVTVHTKAGRLLVEWLPNGRLKLTSTANVVAEGTYLEA
ncbi:MAG: diaminopimelate epimerase [Acidobacteria bacterium]|nr:diaminopimelate epimerase [Acidobacteriota bacterium]